MQSWGYAECRHHFLKNCVKLRFRGKKSMVMGEEENESVTKF